MIDSRYLSIFSFSVLLLLASGEGKVRGSASCKMSGWIQQNEINIRHRGRMKRTEQGFGQRWHHRKDDCRGLLYLKEVLYSEALHFVDEQTHPERCSDKLKVNQRGCSRARTRLALLILFGCPFYCSTWFALVTFRKKRNSPLIHIFFIRPLIFYSSFIKEYIKHHLRTTPSALEMLPSQAFSESPSPPFFPKILLDFRVQALFFTGGFDHKSLQAQLETLTLLIFL